MAPCPPPDLHPQMTGVCSLGLTLSMEPCCIYSSACLPECCPAHTASPEKITDKQFIRLLELLIQLFAQSVLGAECKQS